MALGTAALILGSGLSDGIARQLTDNLVAVQTGEMMVVKREEGFVRQNSPFDAYSREPIENGEAVIREIEKRSGDLGILQVAPYLHARGTAIASNRSTPAVVLGIVPEREPELFKALPPVRGTVLGGQPEEVYVGEPVAKILRLSVGDSVSLLIQTPQGAMNSLDAVVCGIFRKGAPWYDNTFFVPLAAARRLEDSPEGVTNIKLRAPGSKRSLETTRAALGTIVSGLSPGTSVESAEEAGRFSFSIIHGFSTIMSAQFFSSLADNALLVAAIELLNASRAPTWHVAALPSMFALFYVLLAPFVGAFADAVPKGKVMFVSNTIKVVGCLMMMFGAHPLLSYAIVGLGAAAYSPAKYGILTELLPPSQLVKANGWTRA